MRGRSLLIPLASATMLLVVGCGGPYWNKAVVVAVRDTEVCFHAPEWGSKAQCESAQDFRPVGEVVVGDCLEVVLAHPTLRIVDVRRASGCAATTVTAPPVPSSSVPVSTVVRAPTTSSVPR